ncbi:hypothetical protein V1264_016980 [Littorina saxatilis]|uniref:Uncharacterized protein n=1 Tax=Littorina saxatilis TaxID=31220 RepID=A0AAN9BI65_9CAEN
MASNSFRHAMGEKNDTGNVYFPHYTYGHRMVMASLFRRPEHEPTGQTVECEQDGSDADAESPCEEDEGPQPPIQTKKGE